MDEQEMIREIREIVIKLNTVLLGANGVDQGLVGEVRDLSKGHNKLTRQFWILVSFLVGSGIIGAGVVSRLLGG